MGSLFVLLLIYSKMILDMRFTCNEKNENGWR